MADTRITLVAGTRPELIKLVPVLLALRARPGLAVTLAVTAQHREMLDQVSAAFGVEPDLDLDLMQPDQSPADVTARVVTAMQETLARMRPDAVLVHGDTTTCLATALAAFYADVPVGHVEAGLRTYDLSAPWPEEMNRRLTDPLCHWCFAPTAGAADNLRAERIPEDRIFVTGNTVVDALLLALPRVREQPPPVPGLPDGALEGRRLVLVTGHRRESFGEPLRALCGAFREIARRFADVVIVYPVHLNPNVRQPVLEILSGVDRVHVIEPLAYPAFVSLLDRSTLVVTDSGGIQEEAPTLGKPVLVTRRATERPEGIEAGLAKLVGTSLDVIVAEASRLLDDPEAHAAMVQERNPYGDGRAGERIADVLVSAL